MKPGPTRSLPDTDEKNPAPRKQEQDLVRRLAQGEEQAWDEFLDIYGDTVYSHVYYTLKRHNFRIPEDEIQDAVQELFERLLADNGRRLRSFEGRGGCSFSGWLRTVCVNHALELIRRRKQPVSIEDLSDATIHQLIEKHRLTEPASVREKLDAERVLECLVSAAKELPPRERLVFRWYYQDERTRDRIADALGIKSNLVDQILFRIRDKLRATLAR